MSMSCGQCQCSQYSTVYKGSYGFQITAYPSTHVRTTHQVEADTHLHRCCTLMIQYSRLLRWHCACTTCMNFHDTKTSHCSQKSAFTVRCTHYIWSRLAIMPWKTPKYKHIYDKSCLLYWIIIEAPIVFQRVVLLFSKTTFNMCILCREAICWTVVCYHTKVIFQLFSQVH